MNAPVACTIVANNYLAYARVLARSFAEHHPDGRFFVLIVDRPDPDLAYEREPFEVVFAQDLGIEQFEHLAFRYSILELSTAVKPAFLDYLHTRKGAQAACYFDPDILITGSLTPLYEVVGRADVVLTPHITQPIEDKFTPGERDFLLSGIYNLGFLGLSFNDRTRPFLAWWHARLYRECLHAVDRGLFVDQKWMDFAPAFLPGAHILREPGYNAAYWNAMHRRLDRTGGAWLVEGQPLRFFHFSGLMHDRPEVISRYQNRLSFPDREDLDTLFADYRARLIASDHETLRHRPYGYGRFDDGTRVPRAARQVLQVADPDGQRWPTPFDSGGADSFQAWLAGSPQSGAVPLSRLALAIWDQRPDVQVVFPAPEGKDRLRFADWLVARRQECELDPLFTAPVEAAVAAAIRAGADRLEGLPRRLWDALAGGEALDANGLTEEDLATLTAEAGHAGPGGARIPYLGLMIHRVRGDLRNVFPDPLGADREQFAWWIVTSGRAEYSLPLAIVRPVLQTLPARQRLRAGLWWRRHHVRNRRGPRAAPPATTTTAPTPAGAGDPILRVVGQPDPRVPGLNVVGWATAPTGVGEACRGTLAALEQAGVPHVVWNLAARADGQRPDDVGQPGQPYDVTLYHANADMTPHVTETLPRWIASGRYSIGYWFWELAHFPIALAPAFRCLDEVWAPTRFCEDAYRALSPIGIRWMPPSVLPPVVSPGGLGREGLGIGPDEFLLYHSFDVLSVPERKNPLGLVEAFGHACEHSTRRLRLLLKINHAEADPALAGAIQAAARDLPVTLLTRQLPRSDVSSLMNACDAYVSLHRSEGLGLPLIEAMYLGKPVIATGYGGVTDFLNNETGWVIRHAMTELDQPRGPYPRGAVWAAPDARHAGELICQVASSPDLARERAGRALDAVRALYLPEVFARRVAEELERILERM